VYADERNTKQNSVTTTSSFTGAFEEDKTRREFISLISINLVKFSFQNERYENFLTGATGYIGKRLLPLLIEQGHHVAAQEKTGFILLKSSKRILP
jgi:hypothetical protein